MRKKIAVTIEAEGRDKGKVFVLQEMPASQAEKWAAKALLAMGRAGTAIPENVETAGLAGIAALGIRALASMSFEDAEPLLDEMFACVQVQPSHNVVRALIEDDIEEVATRLKLRAELIDLHLGFSIAARLSTSGPAAGTTTAEGGTPAT